MSEIQVERTVLGALGCSVSLSALIVPMQAEAAETMPVTPPLSVGSGLLGIEASVYFSEEEEQYYPGMRSPAADSDLAQQIEALATELREQRKLIAEQNDIIKHQQAAIDQLNGQLPTDNGLALMRATGFGQTETPSSAPPMPTRTVGEAPPQDDSLTETVIAIPQGQGVLTPKGSTVLETSFDYTRTSKNRLVFRGFELIPGLQVGLIEASDADRDTMVGTISVRHGITDRLEIEARMPVLARHDRIQVVQQRDEGIVRSLSLTDHYIGDAEVAVRYQFNDAKGPDQPIFVGNLRVKSNTGRGPFDIGYDEFGVATGLTTGSGFWGVQGGVSFLIPSDPVVIYGGTSYLYHIPATVNKSVGGALVGRVDPGDAISGNLGFGFALNSRFSFSLGYNHSYIFPTKTEINATTQRSTPLQVGSFAVGASYRTSDRTSVNIGFEFGMTSDAPDVSMTLRLPLRF
jgi:hypothetical protein